ncbi:MAG TPA: sigma-70 family RNA polymerase sigma factor [Polyangia bacterium]|nr:sigma-70 family RNA polymerase sigma factor [Polyangia bacterium]
MSLARKSDNPLRLVRGDEPDGSLDGIYRRYCRYVAAVILRLDARPDDLEDLIQDVFVEAARGIERLREAEAIKGWLATIAVRLVTRRLKRRRLRRFFLLGGERGADGAQVADTAASPVDKLLLTEVYRVLDRLPVDERVAFVLHHIEGETLDAVARLTSCSLATTKRRIARAQAAIELELGDREGHHA